MHVNTQAQRLIVPRLYLTRNGPLKSAPTCLNGLDGGVTGSCNSGAICSVDGRPNRRLQRTHFQLTLDSSTSRRDQVPLPKCCKHMGNTRVLSALMRIQDQQFRHVMTVGQNHDVVSGAAARWLGSICLPPADPRQDTALDVTAGCPCQEREPLTDAPGRGRRHLCTKCGNHFSAESSSSALNELFL